MRHECNAHFVASSLGNVLVGCQPASIAQSSAQYQDDAPIAQLVNFSLILQMRPDVLRLAEPAKVAASGAKLQDFGQRRSGRGQPLGYIIDLSVTLHGT